MDDGPRRWFCCLVLIFLIGGAAACTRPVRVQPPIKTGQVKPAPVIAGEQWWDHYQRGLSLAESGREKEALAEFAEAIKQRPDEQWRAATGTDRQIDYFPLRETGIIRLHNHDYHGAVQALENSLAAAPSARAAFFLDRARAEKISRYNEDNAEPQLHLESSSARTVTRSDRWRVHGVARDDTYIAAIRVNDLAIPLEFTTKQKIFTIEQPLELGENIIRVTATDLAGKTTEEQLNIFCDREGPRIEIEHLTIKERQITFTGILSDNNGLISLRVNDEFWPIAGHKQLYRFTFRLPEGDIIMKATDLAGNTTTAVVRKEETAQLLGSVDSDQVIVSEMSGRNPGSPEAWRVPTRNEPDRQAPFINISGIAADWLTYGDNVRLEGMVSDDSPLIYISINGRQIMNRSGRKVYFSLLRELAEGRNELAIAAADEYGNKVVKRLAVTRIIPQILRPEKRMKIAVLPLAGGKNQAAALALSLKNSGRFRIIEPKNIAMAMAAFFTDINQQPDRQQAALIGSSMGADAVLLGRIEVFPDGREISGSLIAAGSAAVLAENDVFAPQPDREEGETHTAEIYDRLADKFVRDLPLVGGSVIGSEKGEYILNIGKKDGIRPGMKLLCYRDHPPLIHPVTGIVQESEPQITATLKVVGVEEKICRGVPLQEKADIMVSDKVITQ